MENKNRETWGSNFGFLMATVGAAVGLGNMWGFPYKIGMNGGFAFLVLYILVVLFVGYILIMTELALGRATGKGVIGAYKAASEKMAVIGWISALVPFLILGFYSYLGGYCLKYTIANLGDIFGASWGVNGVAGPQYFEALMLDQGQSALYTGIFLLVTILIVSMGVSKGIERFNKVAMPSLFVMLLIVILRSLTLPGAGAGLSFLFKPNFEVFKGTGWISVLASAGGQAFFSLSLGMGVTVTYGSYLAKGNDLEKNSIIIPAADTLVALMAGLAIMPAVAASGQEFTGGVGLLYMTLQTVFNGMGRLGAVFGFIFYGLVTIAALTSDIAVLEAVCGSFIDSSGKNGSANRRVKVTWIVGILGLIEGILVALDGLGTYFPPIFGKFCWLDGFDLVSEGLLMPIGSLVTAIYFGWIRRDFLVDEIRNGSEFRTEKFYRFCLKFVAPVFLVLILAGQLDSFFGFGWF